MKPPLDMTAGAWAFMVVAWGILIVLTSYCFVIILRGKKKEGAPPSVPTP